MRGRFILMIENDFDDRYFTQTTIDELALDVPIRYISYDRFQMESFATAQQPALIIISCHKSPRQAMDLIEAIKAQSILAHIPVVLLTETIAPSTVQEYYRTGANTVITKPSSVALTEAKIGTFFKYWLEVAEL